MPFGAMATMYELSQETDTVKRAAFGPEAIRHLPPARQRRYVRLCVLATLRNAERDLSAPEVQERTGFDSRTVRDQLSTLVATREVERINRRGPATYRLIGQSTSPFSKHMVRLKFGAYTIDHARTPDGQEVMILQERMETKDGTFEPVGGLVIRREDMESFMEAVRRRAEDTLDIRLKEEKA